MIDDNSTTSVPMSSRVDRPSTPADPSEAQGTTVITDGVVSKVAGLAARAVPGVFALGGGGARALGAIRNAVNATDVSQGVRVEVGETQVAVDITIVVEYPTPIQIVVNGVRTSVIEAITSLVGLEVVEVNITVDDVHLPTDDSDDDDTPTRVS